MYFQNLRRPKMLLGKIPKKPRFRTPFNSQQSTPVKSKALLSHFFITLGQTDLENVHKHTLTNEISSEMWELVAYMQHFWNLYHILNILHHYMVRHISNKPRFRTPFNSQRGPKHLRNLQWKMFSMGGICFLVICEILGVFVNTLTSDDKYRVRDCDKLLLPIQGQLSKKRKKFRHFCSFSGIYIKF